MVPVGAAVRNAEEQREFQRERTLRGLLHRPTQGDSSHGGLRLQDRARAGWQVRRLRLRDWRVERNSPPADRQGEYVYSRSVYARGNLHVTAPPRRNLVTITLWRVHITFARKYISDS